MRIKKQIIKQILGDEELKLKLIKGLKKSYPTIQRWLNENHQLLTTADALEILQNELGLKQEEILERPKQRA